MYKTITNLLKNGRSPIVYTAIRGDKMGQIAVKDDDCVFGNRDLIVECDHSELPVVKNDVLIEQIATHPHLVLCGAGHVSVFTAKIAKLIGFRITVIDDRTEFANRDRFPDCDEIINESFADALNRIQIANAYYVIVTRGHQDDTLCLETILRKPFAYCGMIGSKAKVKTVFDQLRAEGYNDQILSCVHSPIGLSIGAVTPEEIAVCIVGEMIQVKNGSCHYSEWDESLIHSIDTSCDRFAMVTLIDKRGSAPRSTGARMIVKSDGTIVSSVGGGFGEYEAFQHAQKMLLHGPSVMRYTCKMHNQEAASLGMICGGEIDILIQIVEV
jgi:xanthine dehydrogenase accessory factor